MRYLLFLGRVAFVLNLFFTGCLVFRYNDIVTDQSLKGFVIVVGWLIAPIVNFLFISVFLISRLFNKGGLGTMPAWLFGANFFILIAQILLMIYI